MGKSVWGILNTQCKARADAAIFKNESNERTKERNDIGEKMEQFIDRYLTQQNNETNTVEKRIKIDSFGFFNFVFLKILFK